MNQASSIEVTSGLSDRDFLTLRLQTEKGVVSQFHLEARGCLLVLKAAQDFRRQIQAGIGRSVESLSAPIGNDHASILLRELILKAQGNWKLPSESLVVCKCRNISAERIAAAVTFGCQTPEEVSGATTACTGCGTCRPQVEAILQYLISYR